MNCYLAGWVGTPSLERYGKHSFLPTLRLERAAELFRRYGAGATFVCRWLPAMRQLISTPAGLVKMAFGSFTLWTRLGAGSWVILLTAIGHAIGSSAAKLSCGELAHRGEDLVQQDLVYIVPACLVVFVAYVLDSDRIMPKDGSAPAT
ncbi:MAG: VTT domain-containing protein [Polyangiaceae bacterium]|nr:VTT domain-containing protein [Polyangiaceae bacterium]